MIPARANPTEVSDTYGKKREFRATPLENTLSNLWTFLNTMSLSLFGHTTGNSGFAVPTYL